MGNNFIVFVDFYNKSDTERPDFYVLTSSDWRNCILRKSRDRARKGLSPVEVTDVNSPIFPKEIQKNGTAREGMAVPLSYVEKEQDEWWKIIDCVKGA